MDNNITVYKDYNQLKVSYEKIAEDIFNYKNNYDEDYSGSYMYSLNEIYNSNVIYYDSIDNITSDKNIKVYNFSVKEINPFNENIELINEYLEKQLISNKTIIISLSKNQINSFSKYLTLPYILTNKNSIKENAINIIDDKMSQGFIFLDYVFLTEKELFKNVRTSKYKYKTNFKYSTKIKNIDNLEIGDYVVHNIHGIEHIMALNYYKK